MQAAARHRLCPSISVAAEPTGGIVLDLDQAGPAGARQDRFIINISLIIGSTSCCNARHLRPDPAASDRRRQRTDAAAGPAPTWRISMKLTTFTDYSLRMLIYLAAQPGRRATIAEIAEAYQISENHLIKVAHFLGQTGWLDNLRGKGGGLALARPPHEIVVGAVVRQTEGGDLPAECFGEESDLCAIARICKLRGVLGQAVDAFYAVLDRCTLADLVHNRAAIGRLLFAGPTRGNTG
jgi:Rrf2 family nitric oxide-sensitive transcriptional repressor